MPSVKVEDVIDRLYDCVPVEVRLHFKQRSKELYGEGLAHVVYGSVLVEYLDLLADERELQGTAISDRQLKEIFRLIEELSGSDDFETVCLVQTGFLEGLMVGKKGLKAFADYMGPRTKNLVSSHGL